MVANTITRLATTAILFVVTFGSQQSRDKVLPVSLGLPSSVSGTVYDVYRQIPVAGAIVTVTGPGSPAGVSTISNDHGEFTFKNLRAGSIRLMAAKVGYLGIAYGALRPGGTGAELILDEGQTTPNLALKLLPSGTVQGLVVTSAGSPMSHVRLTAFRAVFQSSYVVSTTVISNELGQYRFVGLQPGEYIVAAAAANEVELGRSLEAPSARDIDALLAELNRRQTPSAAQQNWPSLAGTLPLLTLSPVYFPGTLDFTRARRVTVIPGEVVSGIDVTWVEGRAVDVSGRVSAPGQVTDLSVAMTAESLFLPLMTIRPSLVREPGDARQFHFTGVTRGRYVIRGFALEGTGSDSRRWSGETFLDVEGDGISNVILTLQPAVTISGQIIRSGTAVEASSAVRVELADTSALATQAITGLGPSHTVSSTASVDGRFEIRNVLPGRYSIRVSTPGWSLLAVAYQGREVLDEVLEIDGSTAGPLTITLTNRLPTLFGALEVPAHISASSYTLIAFPVSASAVRNARIRMVRPNSKGEYAIRDLLPGEYIVGAVSDIEPNDPLDQSLLDELRGVSARAVVALGENKTLNLKITGR